ncbi:class I SAM-dependent methyltransferase [Pseudomonas arsenicoxydans]|uniref:Class I SAM-dependent methyltransferase n=1 Tax=Pseudomonas arsenicoxydans TaxID=702115 RepID=A0A4P6G959_9PSED|nr:methyltransferase domain-containing protein [Pseudomonas arsenicoxydans]QAY87757.1 class I SAM-dependent methyltransferase [Pseudomonas arsenicoxydans]
MNVLPPGTILQLMYLKDRLRQLEPGTFVEIGAGAGNISALLLSMGWTGKAYDLESSTVSALRSRFSVEIQNGQYQAVNEDWLSSDTVGAYDLVISCMVMEHFDEKGERAFIQRGKDSLSKNGVMITIVPGSLKHWGIEDEIAGHYRRYTKEAVSRTLADEGLSVVHTAGLTFPVSNILYPLSNYLVRRSEAKKLSLSMVERTKQSGIRNVGMKTTFPKVLGLLLNQRVLYPLHILQKIFSGSSSAMVLYCEARPESRR